MNTIQTQLQRGWKIHQQKRYAEAEQIYRKATQDAADSAFAWCYLGIALHDQRKYHDAVNAYRSALNLEPDFPIALNNLGNSLRYTGQFEEADQSFQRAIDLKPDYLNAYKNRGTLHVWTGNLDLGLQYYQQALKLNPDEAELHRNLGVIYLLQGQFEQGWQEYRWRWKVGDLHRPFSNIPVWDGSDPDGKSMLLTAEQGLGDTLHFVRFATELRKRGAQTLTYCQAPLVPLLQNSPDLGPIYPNSLHPSGKFHCQCSLLDVADLLKIDDSNIPANQPYLHSSPQLDAHWKLQVPTLDASSSAGRAEPSDEERLRIGIAWQGNPDHQADAFRSVPLSEFHELASLPNVELISLQSGYGTEQLADWNGPTPIVTLGDAVDKSSGAFMDTAAIMKTLDLVITSDTAIAHLAGGLGIRAWVALGYVPDWRWLLSRDDSPWYPTIKLFRQSKIGHWGDVFQRMKNELSNFHAQT